MFSPISSIYCDAILHFNARCAVVQQTIDTQRSATESIIFKLPCYTTSRKCYLHLSRIIKALQRLTLYQKFTNYIYEECGKNRLAQIREFSSSHSYTSQQWVCMYSRIGTYDALLRVLTLRFSTRVEIGSVTVSNSREFVIEKKNSK